MFSYYLTKKLYKFNFNNKISDEHIFRINSA